MSVEAAILFGAALATIGWLYTGRRQRTVARKHHTFNTVLQANFNKDFQNSLKTTAPHLKKKECPDLENEDNKSVYYCFRTLLNHYEFIAAGIRNGDVDEQLIRDSERSSILALFETCHDHIYSLRDNRDRQTAYEHIEWLHRRWTKHPPNRAQALIEWARGRPFQGKRHPAGH